MIWQEESYIICMIAKLIEDGKVKFVLKWISIWQWYLNDIIDKMRTILAWYWKKEKIRRYNCFQCETCRVCRFYISYFTCDVWRRSSKSKKQNWYRLKYVYTSMIFLTRWLIEKLDRAFTLHSMAWSWRTVVHAFCGNVFKETLGNTTRKWTSRGPLQCRCWENWNCNFMWHLPSTRRGRRGKIYLKKYFREFLKAERNIYFLKISLGSERVLRNSSN